MNSTHTVGFVERRGQRSGDDEKVQERRQFAESRDTLSPEVRELAEAIDAYKLSHGRRHVTLTEVFEVLKGLGYHK